MIKNPNLSELTNRIIICSLLVVLLVLRTAAQTVSDAGGTAGLVGTWILVSTTFCNDGKDNDFDALCKNKEQGEAFYGENPQGLLIFDRSGRYSLMVFRSKLKNFWFESENRETGTPDENRRVVQWSIANYGRYSIKENLGKEKELHLLIEAATFPNWVTGKPQIRLFRINPERDELTYVVNPASTGGGVATFVWKREK
jgi:hypothetical protein